MAHLEYILDQDNHCIVSVSLGIYSITTLFFQWNVLYFHPYFILVQTIQIKIHLYIFEEKTNPMI